MTSTNFNFEFRRKLFHISSILLSLIYLFVSKFSMCLFLLLIVATTIYIDISRRYNIIIQELVSRFFNKLMRALEKNNVHILSSASYMVIGFFISCLMFPKNIAIVSWLVLIISDSVAAIVGSGVDNKFTNGKSVEGAFAFFFSSFIIGIICSSFIEFHISFLTLIISCIVTTIAELYSNIIRIDDNLLIPIVFGLTIIIINWLFYG